MKKVMLIVVGMLFASGVNAAGIYYFSGPTGVANFEASHYSGAIEDFEDTTLNSSLTITSTNSTEYFKIEDGVMKDRADKTGSSATTFEFGSAINAWGGLFDLEPNGYGSGLAFTYHIFSGGSLLLSEEISGVGANGFWGFITKPNVLFNKLVITAGSNSGVETYTLDNMRYGLHTDPSAVPVPAALLLFAPALLGFLGLRRKAAVAA